MSDDGSWRDTAVDRGVRMVAFRDKLEEVRGRVRVLLEAAERVLAVDIPSTRGQLEEAVEDLRSFAWPRTSAQDEDDDHDDEDEHE